MTRVALITERVGYRAAIALVLAEHGYRVVVNHRAITPGRGGGRDHHRGPGEAVAIKATSPRLTTSPPWSMKSISGGVGSTCSSQRVDAVCRHLVRRAELGAARRQAGQRAACRLLTTKAVVPGMVSRGYGRLIYLSTGLSRHPRDGMITLGTAEAALDQFVRYFALELAPHRITANLVAPGTVEGQGHRASHGRADARARGGRTDATARPSRRGGRDGGVIGG